MSTRPVLAVVPAVPVAKSETDFIWFSTGPAASYAGCHVDTLRRALEAGECHGNQRTKPKGRWRIHRDCLDAWCGGEPCAHQTAAADL